MNTPRRVGVLSAFALLLCGPVRAAAPPAADTGAILLSPSPLAFASYGPSSPLAFDASEAGYTGNFKVVSADPSTAVTLDAASEHRFVVLAKKDGATTFTVSDTLGHTAQLPVTVTGPLRSGRLYVPISYFPALRIVGLLPNAEPFVQYNFQNTPEKLAFAPDGSLYIASSGNPAAVEVIPLYPQLNGSGQPIPSRTLAVGGSVWSLTTDPKGYLFVAEEVGTATLEVAVYAANASGTDPPLQTITFADPMRHGGSVALGALDELYVSRWDLNEVDVYAADPRKPPRKTRSIVGPTLNEPYALAVGASGELYVSNYATVNVTVYAKGAHGPATPLRTISIANLSGNCGVRQLATAAGYLYVVSDGVYQLIAGRGGAQTPLAVITSTAPDCFIQDVRVGP